MPTDTSQLLRQLSFNAGEMGMPGGYVGAVQLPSYGSTLQPVNNPDMSKYGQGAGLGEATFYQQSMKGGMTPISAMSPLGVPDGWNPGGTTTPASSKTSLDSYLSSLFGKSGSKTGGSLPFDFSSLFGLLSGGWGSSSGGQNYYPSSSRNQSQLLDLLKKFGINPTSSAPATTTPASSLPPPTGGVPITPPNSTTP